MILIDDQVSKKQRVKLQPYFADQKVMQSNVLQYGPHGFGGGNVESKAKVISLVIQRPSEVILAPKK